MNRVMYVPCDDSLLRMPANRCPKCYGKNYTESWRQDERGDPCGADMDCLDCGHLWGWRV